MITHHELMHGHDWDGRIVTGWHASEKLDGCRALWTGSELITRTGNVIDAPDWFVATLPWGFPLDGEVWAGYGRLQEARRAVQHGLFTFECRYKIFDAPTLTGPWRERLRVAATLMATTYHASFVTSWTNWGVSDLKERLKMIQDDGGEGIVLRDPTCLRYRPGRSDAILKVKRWPATISASGNVPSCPTVAA